MHTHTYPNMHVYFNICSLFISCVPERIRKLNWLRLRLQKREHVVHNVRMYMEGTGYAQHL